MLNNWFPESAGDDEQICVYARRRPAVGMLDAALARLEIPESRHPELYESARRKSRRRLRPSSSATSLRSNSLKPSWQSPFTMLDDRALLTVKRRRTLRELTLISERTTGTSHALPAPEFSAGMGWR
jgi:hypothetical protein